MRLFKKFGFAILVTVLMIVLLLLIGGRGVKQAANRDYYERWIIDEAMMLSDDAKRSFGVVNEELDKTFGSVLGVITVDSLDGKEIGEAVYELGESSGFGQNDMVLLISATDRKWYLGYGDQLAPYADQSLRLLVINCLDDELYEKQTDREIGKLYDKLPDWYAKHVPKGGTSAYRRTGISGAGFFRTLLRMILTVFVAATLFRFLLYPLFSFRRIGKWSPLGGWVLFPILALLFRRKAVEHGGETHGTDVFGGFGR